MYLFNNSICTMCFHVAKAMIWAPYYFCGCSWTSMLLLFKCLYNLLSRTGSEFCVPHTMTRMFFWNWKHLYKVPECYFLLLAHLINFLLFSIFWIYTIRMSHLSNSVFVSQMLHPYINITVSNLFRHHFPLDTVKGPFKVWRTQTALFFIDFSILCNSETIIFCHLKVWYAPLLILWKRYLPVSVFCKG